ncbi:unnamed protein product [Ceutorhynchus assimilis]|uniref:Uncharacterized protein n=1 Tax=Ceutorhynchus assimilis TaxID=467358 RepID=A0A9N9QLD2_9CUCU|nr:unnamed protein product [Ceutorhynchus assimilis]
MMFKGKRFSTELLFQESKLLSVEQLYTRAVIRFMLTNSCYRNKLSTNHNIRSAANQNLALSFVRLSATQRHISYTGPTVYNALPVLIKGGPFKKVKHLVNQWIIESNFSLNF